MSTKAVAVADGASLRNQNRILQTSVIVVCFGILRTLCEKSGEVMLKSAVRSIGLVQGLKVRRHSFYSVNFVVSENFELHGTISVVLL